MNSCMLDFTPRIHKDILKAQQLILEQKYQYAISIYERILKESPEDKIKVKIYYQLGELFSINLSKNGVVFSRFSLLLDRTGISVSKSFFTLRPSIIL